MKRFRLHPIWLAPAIGCLLALTACQGLAPANNNASTTLSISPASLSFGTANVGASATLSASLMATGGTITVSSATSSSGEFTLSGITLPATISTGQSAPFTVTFTPNAAGAASANLIFLSNASNPSAAQPLNGTGQAQAQSHSVGLSWNPSNGAVSYNVYRKASTDPNYTQIDSGEGETSYTDNSVSLGVTYDYAVTAVSAEDQESGYSNIAEAVIPND